MSAGVPSGSLLGTGVTVSEEALNQRVGAARRTVCSVQSATPSEASPEPRAARPMVRGRGRCPQTEARPHLDGASHTCPGKEVPVSASPCPSPSWALTWNSASRTSRDDPVGPPQKARVPQVPCFPGRAPRASCPLSAPSLGGWGVGETRTRSRPWGRAGG